MTNRSFNLDEPLAYFLTWTTYGTWLPGEERGWHKIHEPGIQPHDPLVWESAELRMKEQAITLTTTQRTLVTETIRDHCVIRGWTLWAVNVRSNHVHVVVTAPGYRAQDVRNQFKAWATRKLKASGLSRKRFWTEGGSCRILNTDADLEATVTYALDAQDRKGRDQM